MAYLKWIDSLSVGVELIDSQHKRMISFINELIEALREGKAEKEADRAVEFLEDYVNQHFTVEEGLMAKLAYPAMQSHIRQHESFRKELGIVKRELESGVPPGMLLMRVRKSLADWFESHINDVDRSLARYIRVRQDAEGQAKAEEQKPQEADAPREPEKQEADEDSTNSEDG